jgi:transmembrane sensor
MTKLEDYVLEDLLQDESFLRYIRDESDADRAIWERFLESYPNKKSMIVEAKAIINQLFAKISPKEFNHELEKFRSIVKDAESLPWTNRINPVWKFISIAASISVLILISLYFYSGKKSDHHNLDKKKEKCIVKRSTDRGQKSTLILKDDTKIRLNSESSIRYPKDFKKDLREIYLDAGEAFFEVSEDLTRPFIVHVDNLTVKVLGTSFNVKSYPAEDKLEVSLLSGRVEILRDGKLENYLTPNTEIQLTKSTGELLKSTFDPSLKLAWKDNIIKFDKTPLPEVISVLERWYDVKIKYEKTVGVKRFTGEFKNMSLENILNGMSHLGFNYSIKEREIKIY